MDGMTLAAINYIEEICKRMDSLMLNDMVGTVREALESEPKNTIHNTAYTKLPSNKTLREFIDDYNVCSDEFGGDDALNMVKDALSEYGNFA